MDNRIPKVVRTVTTLIGNEDRYPKGKLFKDEIPLEILREIEVGANTVEVLEWEVVKGDSGNDDSGKKESEIEKSEIESEKTEPSSVQRGRPLKNR